MPEGLNISSGIGTGAAQVFKPYESNYGAQVASIGQQKRKAQSQREQDVYKGIGDIKMEGIFFKHQPVFAQKQAELKDWTKQNIDALRKGDPTATIEFQNRLTKLGTDIGLSKNVNTGYKEMFGEYIKNQGKYREGVIDYMDEFQGYDPNSDQFEPPDMSKMQMQTDLGADFKSNVLPLLEKAKVEGQISWDNPDGSVTTRKVAELTKKDADALFSSRLKDPVVFEQAVYDYSKENPSNPNPAIEDVQEFYYERYVKPFVKKEQFITKTEGGKSGGLNLSFGGNTAENEDVRVVVEDTPEKRVYNIAQIKSSENSTMDFSLADGTVIKGTPLRIERSKSTGGKDVVVAIPEMKTVTEGFGSRKTTKEVPTGKMIEKRVPYKLNENRVFKGKYNFSIEDVDKGIVEEGVEVKSAPKKDVKKVENLRKKYNY